jgi:hypothetical protein
MADEIKITYRMTPQEITNAARARTLHSLSLRLIAGFFIALLLLFILEAAIFGASPAELLPALWPTVIVIVLFGFLALANPFLAWRVRRDSKSLSEQTWEFSDARVHVKSEHGEASNEWSAYPRAGEDKRFFYLYISQSQNLFYPIPKRALPSLAEESNLRDLLKRKIAKWV